MSHPFTARLRARTAAMRILPQALAGIFIGLLSSAAIAANASLTLADAQHLAVERSRQIAAKDYAVAASREMAIAAGRLPDPMLSAGIDNLPANGPERFSLTSDFMTMRRIGVMQELTRADKRRLRSNRFEREAEKSLAEKAMTTAAIERDTALAWFERYYAEAMAAVIEEQVAQAKLELQAADGGYRSGRSNQADVIAARSTLADLENRTSESQRRLRNARTMLARWIGNAADMPLGSKPATDVIRLDAAALDTQLAHHPQIAVLAKQEEIAATEAQLAKANKKADWSVEVMYSQRGPRYANMLSIGVSVPLQWDQKNRQDRELSAKLAMVEEAKAERDDLLQAHVAETRMMINEWQNTLERQARYERELIPLAGERTLAAVAAYRGGKAGLVDVLAARRNEIDVRTQMLQLETDAARLWAQLNFLFPSENAALHSSR